ncbi:tRNA guanosine(34) transglycosylase Tgt [Candidatus Pacearchaeota archaeon]|nr:tRNA guanosine(34) transglycosylase Tgt [Candidatus Pacearchaeota archaeon]
MTFKILYKDKKTNARLGLLTTKSGDIETPFFMPVATKATAKYLSTDDLISMKAKASISNAFLLSVRPNSETIRNAGGLSKFMSFNGITFTDSGGFQMYSPHIYLKSNDSGVFFKDPLNGEKFFITPEKNMKIQLEIGADVAMCLDTMPLLEHSKSAITEAVRKTTLWAKKCKEIHNNLQKKISKNKRQLLFGITQGGIYSDIRELSVKQLVEINFDGYALGGLALGESKEEEYKMIEISKLLLPEEKPVYLMGAGNPLELLEAISRGIDIFDSRFPTKSARRGTLFTSKGRISISNQKYKFDKSPIDFSCSCFVCKNYSKSYIRHLVSQEEGSGMRLTSYHNLFFLISLLEKVRDAIKKGSFNHFKEKFKKTYKDYINIEEK